MNEWLNEKSFIRWFTSVGKCPHRLYQTFQRIVMMQVYLWRAASAMRHSRLTQIMYFIIMKCMQSRFRLNESFKPSASINRDNELRKNWQLFLIIACLVTCDVWRWRAISHSSEFRPPTGYQAAEEDFSSDNMKPFLTFLF